MQVSFFFFALVLILLVALVFGSISLLGIYNGNKLLRQPQKINQNSHYGRYQDETKIWQRHR